MCTGDYMWPSDSPQHIWIHLGPHLAVDLLGRVYYRWGLPGIPVFHARNVRSYHTQAKSAKDAQRDGQSQYFCANRT